MIPIQSAESALLVVCGATTGSIAQATEGLLVAYVRVAHPGGEARQHCIRRQTKTGMLKKVTGGGAAAAEEEVEERPPEEVVSRTCSLGSQRRIPGHASSWAQTRKSAVSPR